jgi:hypothetical protein
MDGTFDACPHLFAQLFTLHVFEHDRLLPVVYCLLPGKTAATYTAVFTALKNAATAAGLQFDPNHILSDFETGLIRAVKTAFPNATHHGCYFHFTQAIWRQLQALGLSADYRNDNIVRTSVRQLMALGFSPLLRVRTVFTQLEVQAPPILRALFVYFRDQWLDRVPPRMWNVFNADHNLRSNNHLEGWHSGFNRTISAHHPNIWRLLTALIKEQANTDVLVQQIAAGQVSNTKVK